MKLLEDCAIVRNRRLKGGYHQVDLATARIAAAVAPGQFVHVRLPELEHRLLRRPFSVCDADPASGLLSIVYKVVGAGTAHLATLRTGSVLSLMGPLGRGFTPPRQGSTPVIVAGGYGCAATYLLACRSPEPCICLLGGRSQADLLLVREFRQAGCTVKLATDDGTRGHRGPVTDLLAEALRAGVPAPAIYACGPHPMLHAVSRIAAEHGLDAEVSLDHAMCCGVGACFACVVRLKADTPDGWEYVRTCQQGPVFKASQVLW